MSIPTPATPRVDVLLDYPAGHAPHDGRCRARVYDGPAGPVLVLSELPDNPGASVTNAAEIVACAAVEQLGLSPARVTVVEHYPHAAGDWRHDTFDRVTYASMDAAAHYRAGGRGGHTWRQLGAASWVRLTAADVAALIGGRVA